MTPTLLRSTRRAVATLLVAAFAAVLSVVLSAAQTTAQPPAAEAATAPTPAPLPTPAAAPAAEPTPAAAPTPAASAAGQKWTLRYKFREGETLRWEVIHLSAIKMTVAGTTQTTDMESKSVKAWKVVKVKADGAAAFEYRLESVDMRNQVSGRQEVRYNSETDEKPPVEFETTAATIGRLLSTIELSPIGEVVQRHQEPVEGMSRHENQGYVTIPLPEQPVAIGESWQVPYDIVISLNNGGIRTIKARQKFTLRGVSTGVAIIQVATVLLTPIHDPAIEVQVVQRQSNGTVRFDIDAGRIMGQQMDVNERVTGFTPNSPASSFHYESRFTERLLPQKATAASGPQAPAALPTAAIGPSPLPRASALKPRVIPDASEMPDRPKTAQRKTVPETKRK